MPVQVSGVPSERLCQPVEAAAYFVTAEALTNVAKYAHATEAFVHLSIEDECLRLQVRDDGIGGADPSTGSGLRGLRDRVDALDGHLELDSPPGGGTILTVEIPVDAASPRGGDRVDGRQVRRHVEPARPGVARPEDGARGRAEVELERGALADASRTPRAGP